MAKLLLASVITLGLCVGVRAVDIELVSVGDPGNVADTEVMCTDSTTGYGAVNCVYRIGKHEVTAAQYCEFLNAVAATDTYGLYNPYMDYDADPHNGCNIKRSGSSGTYSYNVSGDWANRPVNYVSWGDVARFANWLHNGRPSGTLTGDPNQDGWLTEDGSYFLNGAMTDPELAVITREPDATWVIPAEDEWYKAAYYKGGGTSAGYWDYATSTDALPNNGNPEGDTGNSANFYDAYFHDPGDYTIGSPYWRTDVGFFSQSESPYGTFDQSGNVWEWNENIFHDETNRVLRGGSYYPDYYPLMLQACYRTRVNPCYEEGETGFRVAKVSEPALVSSEPPADGTLPKIANNVILLTFCREFVLPPDPPLQIVSLVSGDDAAGSFTYSKEPDSLTLEATENADVLANRTWYQVTPTAELGVEPFTLVLCVLWGDANGSGRVTTADYVEVKAHMGEYTDARYDLNGTGRVTTADYTIVKAHLGNRKPDKPPLLWSLSPPASSRWAIRSRRATSTSFQSTRSTSARTTSTPAR